MPRPSYAHCGVPRPGCGAHVGAIGEFGSAVPFAAIAPILSFAALRVVSLLPSAAAQFIGFCLASMIGAASYWFLVRAFWIHKLTFISLLSAVGLCSAVTLVWALTFRHSLFFAIQPLILTIHTLCWWLAFSFSLYLSERASSA